MRRAATAVALALLTIACTRTPLTSPGPRVTSSSSPSPLGSSPTVSPRAFLPDPDRPVPGRAADLASDLVTTTRELHSAIDRWLDAGDPWVWPPPEDVELLALYQQRLARKLGADPKLLNPTIEKLPARLRGEVRANASAAANLLSLVHPISGPSGFATQRPLTAGALLDYYREAEGRFGVAWEVLAAVNHVESKFGRVRSASYAGAQGPMQFIPSTWAAYGLGGDVHDPHDAIMGAANYLRASGAPHDYRRALYAYNPSNAYVDAVMAYAEQMMDDPHDYYAYYNWQVFVETTSGSRRLTGPGLD